MYAIRQGIYVLDGFGWIQQEEILLEKLKARVVVSGIKMSASETL